MDEVTIAECFDGLFKYGAYDLPIRCKTNEYYEKLKYLLNDYKNSCFWWASFYMETYDTIVNVCNLIIEILQQYLGGKTSAASKKFGELYETLVSENFLSVYSDIDLDPNLYDKDNKHSLYRMRKVDDNICYSRKDIFHTPFNLRNKISTNRYSMAGYPCLYLSSSIDLCKEELECNLNPGRYIISRFELNKDCYIKPRIIELGIKPQDFYDKDARDSKHTVNTRRASLNKKLLDNDTVKRNYMIWYPFIAACSFIRPNKNTPFSIEYVLPQLLMQHVIEKIVIDQRNPVHLGIRYFSCASMLSSEIGFNYVFPTNYEKQTSDNYCSVLASLFQLTEPIFITDYKSNNHLLFALEHKKLDYYSN